MNMENTPGINAQDLIDQMIIVLVDRIEDQRRAVRTLEESIEKMDATIKTLYKRSILRV